MTLRERAKGVLKITLDEQEAQKAVYSRSRRIKASKMAQVALYERIDPDEWQEFGTDAMQTEVDGLTLRVWQTGEIALVTKIKGKTEILPANSLPELAMSLYRIGEIEP